jgi:hypothetical protein
VFGVKNTVVVSINALMKGLSMPEKSILAKTIQEFIRIIKSVENLKIECNAVLYMHFGNTNICLDSIEA